MARTSKKPTTHAPPPKRRGEAWNLYVTSEVKRDIERAAAELGVSASSYLTSMHLTREHTPTRAHGATLDKLARTRPDDARDLMIELLAAHDGRIDRACGIYSKADFLSAVKRLGMTADIVMRWPRRWPLRSDLHGGSTDARA